jgi:hypothetical protein
MVDNRRDPATPGLSRFPRCHRARSIEDLLCSPDGVAARPVAALAPLSHAVSRFGLPGAVVVAAGGTEHDPEAAGPGRWRRSWPSASRPYRISDAITCRSNGRLISPPSQPIAVRRVTAQHRGVSYKRAPPIFRLSHLFCHWPRFLTILFQAFWIFRTWRLFKWPGSLADGTKLQPLRPVITWTSGRSLRPVPDCGVVSLSAAGGAPPPGPPVAARGQGPVGVAGR